ncbi:MAG: hypothetical protein H7176_05670 [Bdellovibrionales bacterium]|nr:hypothetical protein [Massilia sp.]
MTHKMDSGVGDTKHIAARRVGVLCGLALALLLTILSFSALSPSNTYGGFGLIFAAIGLGGPLFLITVGMTIYLVYKSAIGPPLAMAIWLPVMASLTIIPLSLIFRAG